MCDCTGRCPSCFQPVSTGGCLNWACPNKFLFDQIKLMPIPYVVFQPLMMHPPLFQVAT